MTICKFRSNSSSLFSGRLMMRKEIFPPQIYSLQSSYNDPSTCSFILGLPPHHYDKRNSLAHGYNIPYNFYFLFGRLLFIAAIFMMTLHSDDSAAIDGLCIVTT